MAQIISFLCRCFGETDRTIELNSVQRRLGGDPSVITTEICDSLCLEEDVEKISTKIKRAGAEKVLLVACSSLARGEIVVRALSGKGIHPANIELVNLREGCAWIHKDYPGGANAKAWDLINMGLASLEHKRRSEDISATIYPEALVIGAGPAGMAAAASLARLGFPVHLVERGSKPGGMLNLTSRLFPRGERPSELFGSLLDAVERDPLVRFYRKAKVTSVEGIAGDFIVGLSTAAEKQKLSIGVIIIACGARPVIPHELYRYGELRNVISQIELERKLNQRPPQAKRVVFIQCVAARSQDRPYCSTICCPTSLKNAVRLLATTPDAEIFVLHRGVMTPGIQLEAYYRQALTAGVKFIRFDPERPPLPEGNGQVESVRVYDALSGKSCRLDADLVVLSTPLAPHEENGSLAAMMSLKRDQHGFFTGNEPMHPLETTTAGVFLCGSARWPVSAEQAIAQGEAVAIKASSFLAQREIMAATLTAVPGLPCGFAAVNPEACSGCGNCVVVCPFGACQLSKVGKVSVSSVNKMICKGCGSCVAVCPNGAIQIPEQNSISLREMLKKAFQTVEPRILEQEQRMTSILTRERGAPKVVVFACKWCGFIGADRAGKARISLPVHFRLITVECAARIEPDLILRALADGIDGVAVLGCHLGGCRYNEANHAAAKRLELLQNLLDAVGVGSTRLLVSWGTAHEPHQFAELMSRFVENIKKQPPLDGWVRPIFGLSYDHAGTGERKS